MSYLLENKCSERLIFRKVSLSDFDAWLKFFDEPETRKYWIEEFETPIVECQKWYDRQLYRYKHQLGGMNALIEKKSNHLIGYCGLLIQTVDGEEELELGYSILPEFWNKGFATEAAIECVNHAFENNLTETLIAIISHSNLPSQSVASKLGMKILKDTQYKRNQVHIYGINQEKWTKSKASDNKF